MRPARSLYFHILALTLLVALPVLGLYGYSLYQEFDSAQARAYAEVESRALGQSKEVGRVLARAEALLEFLSGREEIRTGEPTRCAALLRGTPSLDSRFVNASLISPDGHSICSTWPIAPSKSFANEPWFINALHSSGAEFTAPVDSRLEKRTVGITAQKVTKERGTLVGVLAVSLDLVKVSIALENGIVVPGETVLVVNNDGVIVARWPAPEVWIGQTLNESARLAWAQSPAGRFTAKGNDGIERVIATSPVAGFPLTVAAGTSTEQTFGALRAKTEASALVAFGALVLVLLIATYGSAWVSMPIRQLGLAIRRRVAEGSAAPIPENQPAEFRDVAIEFNKLNASRDAFEGSLATSERRAQRLAGFYATLSNANQSIVRRVETQAVYEGICRTCVSAGHATMAWIGQVDGVHVLPVAWGGPARSYTSSLQASVEEGALWRPEGPTSRALETRLPYVANDYSTDEWTLPSRDTASEFGVRSAAAFPFCLKGTVVGVLNVYALEPDYFDDELVAVLAELAADVSFTLEDRVRETEQRQFARSVLRHEKQLADIVKTATDAILSVDLAGRIQVSNTAAEVLFQLTSDEAADRLVADFLPEFAQESRQGIHRGGVVPITGRRLDGAPLDLEASFSSAMSGGNVLRTVVLRDVSKRRDVERAQQAQAKSDASSQAKSQFISRMSHELRTPLNAVLGFSQLLQSTARPRLNDQEQGQLDLIHAAGVQLRALIDDVLDVSRIEAGTLAVEMKVVNLHALLDETLRLSEAAAGQRKVKLRAENRGEPPMMLWTDPLRLRQALLNLVSNAIKYGRAQGFVSVGITRTEGKVEISVTDNGLGMTAAQLAGTFQPFNRLGRENSEIQGTGIGLVITRQLIELLGGTVSIQSDQEHGTRASIFLPHPDLPGAVTSEVEDDVAHAPAAKPKHESDSSGHETSGSVLYIEDEPVNAILVQQLLARWPEVRLAIAEDGEDGMAQAVRLQPDLILLDMRLPDMDGIELLARLRGDPRTRDIQVVSLSASALTEEVAEAISAGALEYWTKPIDFPRFLSGIRRLLEREGTGESGRDRTPNTDTGPAPGRRVG